MALRKEGGSTKKSLDRKSTPSKAQVPPAISPAVFPGESPTVSLALAAGTMYGHAAQDQEPAQDKPARSKAQGEAPKRGKAQGKSSRARTAAAQARSAGATRKAKP